MKFNVEFSLILACFNEEENLERTVDISIKTLSSFFKSFEIIIIDDDSFDKTFQIAKRLEKNTYKFEL